MLSTRRIGTFLLDFSKSVVQFLGDIIALCRGEITFMAVPLKTSVMAQLGQRTGGTDFGIIKNGLSVYFCIAVSSAKPEAGASPKKLMYMIPGHDHEAIEYKLPKVKLSPETILGFVGVIKVPKATMKAISKVAKMFSISPRDVVHNSVSCYLDLVEIADRGGQFFWEENGTLTPVDIFVDD
jgi:hypothetical protein